MKEIRLPEICLVLLIGPSSSGKSTFAKEYFADTEVLSSDYCRSLVADDENDLAATDDAFQVLQLIAAKRLKRGKLTIVDALNLRKEDRAKMVALARDNYALAAAIVIQAPIRLLFDRHDNREDRKFTKTVLQNQFDDLKRSARSIEKEGFSYVYYVNPAEEEYTISRQRLWNNKQEEKGPFDIIGDVHGCFDELQLLITKLGHRVYQQEDGHFTTDHPENRKLVFLGDLTDRGPKSPQVLRLVMDLVNAGKALCITGNHDEKLQKHLSGKNVPLTHGLDKTVAQFNSAPKEFQKEVKEFLYKLIAHYVLDGGRLVVAHAGLPEEMQGRAAAVVRSFCLYGETTGEIDEFGLPVRHEWAKRYKGKAMVVFGHTPVPAPEWLNNTINIDTGCVFGGSLTALRYPEKELVTVQSREVYCEPVRPLVPEKKSSPDDNYDDLLDADLITGKNIIETFSGAKIIIREENAVAAFEVISRFAQDPRWLIYLPPTMSPPATSKLPGYLEHPAEVFDYYRKHNTTELICQEKHMGSRAIAIILKDPEVALSRFGFTSPAAGTVYTRTGRKFFEEEDTESAFLHMLHHSLTASGFWERHQTDWVCLDGELMPWSAKAKDLIVKQYAAVGSAAKNGLSYTLKALQKANERGVPVQSLINTYRSRDERIKQYIHAYRNYTRETNGITGLVFAPFHILAAEGKTFFEKTHSWHLEEIAKFCAYDKEHLMVTPHKFVDVNDDESVSSAIQWWLDLTSKGGEGMVVKPVDFIGKDNGRKVQPAMKCRGSEYLRIIYGPEYDAEENLERLKFRNVKLKRELALKEFALGIESLNRFTAREPLSRVHQCVFGVLALESESIDPRL